MAPGARGGDDTVDPVDDVEPDALERTREVGREEPDRDCFPLPPSP